MSLIQKILLPGGINSARRCLFEIDDQDREKLHAELDAQAEKMNTLENERFIDRWCFDPIKGEPVQQEKGKWEYVALDAKNVPSFYTAAPRQRPARPARSPCQARNSPVAGLPSRPTKRRLRFDDNTVNDENREVLPIMAVPVKQAKTSSVDLVETFQEISPAASCTLTSPPISPPVSSIHPPTYSPMSPSVLSSSCPPALDTSVVSRLSPVLEKESETPDMPKFSRSVSQSGSFPVKFSPSLQAREYVTPNSTRSSGNLVQRVMTDYACVRKRRSSKPSPRS